MKFRDLKEEDVEVRPAQVGDGYVSLLLYKNARCDMNILDEEVGIEGWQRKHYEVKGNLFCSVGIRSGNEWIWKDDCGVESNTEKKKGEASDSFKRACFNWGIGRELYTAPKIYLSLETVTENGKFKLKDEKKISFSVTKFEVLNKKISSLEIQIFNSKTKQKDVWNWSLEKPEKEKKEKEPLKPIEEKEISSKSAHLILNEILRTKDKNSDLLKQIKEIIDRDYGGKRSSKLNEIEAQNILSQISNEADYEDSWS